MAAEGKPPAKVGCVAYVLGGFALLLLLAFVAILLMGWAMGVQPAQSPEKKQAAIMAEKTAKRAAERAKLKADPNYYVRYVDQTWLVTIAGIETTPPKTTGDLWYRVLALTAIAMDMEDSQPFDDRTKVAYARAYSALSKKQAEAFPPLRRAYVEMTDEKVWEHNVDVEVLGKRATEVRWTSFMFADRGSIQVAHEQVAQDLRKLRFKRSAYRWMPLADQTWRYSLDAPDDAQPGRWDDNGQFHPLPKPTL